VLEVIGWGGVVSISPKNTCMCNRSKMRHALPWLSLAGGRFGGGGVSIPPKDTCACDRSKMRHALPWLPLAGGGILSFEGGCALEDISWGGTSSPTTRRQKWRGHALSRGGVARIAFFSKHRFLLSPRRDPPLRGPIQITSATGAGAVAQPAGACGICKLCYYP
jgi:hypothetical protein